MLNLSPVLRLCSRVGSAQHLCCWPPALARRVNQHLDCLSRQWMMPSQLPISLTGATSKCVNKWKVTKAPTLVMNSSSTTVSLDRCNKMEESIKFTSSNPRASDIPVLLIQKNSNHRDGAIYKNNLLLDYWYDYDYDITDRTETCLEPMTSSESYIYFEGDHILYSPTHMLQFFSVTLAQSSISNDSIQLYGYIAVRDERDGLLNYILKYSRDDPAVVHQGSLIEMTGPKRGISASSPVLMEFDLRIKNGEREEDDMQLIDGATSLHCIRPLPPFKGRITTGQCGVVDVSFAYIEYAVEATIEVVVSEVERDFSLFLSSLVNVVEDHEEIALFHGTIDQPCGLRRFVVAVAGGTKMLLKFKVGNDNVEYYRSFEAIPYGCDCQLIKFEFGSISAKVTWCTF